MIDYVTEIIKIEKVQYVCDKCGIKSKRITKGEKQMPSGWVTKGFLIHYCPMCAMGKERFFDSLLPDVRFKIK